MDESRRATLLKELRSYFDGRDARPVAADDLAADLDVSERDRPHFIETLYELEEQGVAVHVDGRGWCSPRREGWLVGTFSAHRKGHAFLRPAREDPRGDVFISARNLQDAHHGDLVLVKLRKPRGGRNDGRGGVRGRSAGGERLRDGRVLRVLRRSPRAIIGIYEEGSRGDGTVEPLRHESLREIYIPAGRRGGVGNGQRVLARLVEGDTVGGLPPGEIVTPLAEEGTWLADLQVVVAEFGLPGEFPDTVLAEAARFPDRISHQELARRKDLRELDFVTIDPEDARDYDDATYLERRHDGGYRLGVAIADVCHYVRAGSELDREAYERSTSVYLPGRVIPMLPERLSNELCSLVPHEDRLARAVWMEISRDGELTDWELESAVIRSARRYTYGEVQAILEGGKPRRDDEALAEMLREMDGLRAVLQERRVERGALDLDLQEQKLILDDEGEVLEVTSRSRDRAHNLIEEFMLMANEAVAQAATVRETPIIRRDHPAPSDDAVETFLRFVRAVAPDVRVSGADDFQRVVSQVAERPVAPVINMALLRTLMRAQYTAEKGHHFALATDEYCHFTSPIRRYPDLQVHRAMFDAPKGKRGGSPSDRTVLRAVAEHCTLREQRAEEAEREMNKLRAIAWLAHRVGERFTGVITTALDYGFFVRLDECMVEGMVHVSTLAGDFYQLHEPSFSLRGRHTGKSFGIGDTIEVRLRRADPIHRHVDLEYLHHRAEPVVASGGGSGSTRKRKRTR